MIQPASDPMIPCRICTEAMIDTQLVREQFGRDLIQLGNGIRLIKTETLSGRCRSVAKSIPDLSLLILITTEENAFWPISCDQDQHSLWFRESSQIVKVAIAAVGI